MAGDIVNIVAPADVDQDGDIRTSGRALNGVITVGQLDQDVQLVSSVTISMASATPNTVDGKDNANFVGVVYRNASGGLTDVDITGIRDPYESSTTVGGHPVAASDMQRGVGLQVDNDTLAHLAFTMTGSSISDFQKNAMVFNHADL